MRALSVMPCRFHNAHEQPVKLIIVQAVTHLPAKYEEEKEKWCVCNLTEPDSYFTFPSSQIHSLQCLQLIHQKKKKNYSPPPPPPNFYAIILHLTEILFLLLWCLHMWVHTRNLVLKIYWYWKFIILTSNEWNYLNEELFILLNEIKKESVKTCNLPITYNFTLKSVFYFCFYKPHFFYVWT